MNSSHKICPDFLQRTVTFTALPLPPLAALHAAEPVAIDLAKRTWQGIPGL